MTAYVPGVTETDPKKVIRSLHELASGRSNAVGTVTLAVSSATTTVTDSNCAAGSGVSLMPTNANAATEFGAGSWFITPANNSFVITHTNSATTGRTFVYVIQG